jgi:hypothetical protein
MGRPDTVLLPQVISPSVLRIGQFLCNPLEPERNKYTPPEDTIKAIKLADPVPTRPFHGEVDLDSRGWFRVMLAHAFGVSIFGSSTTTLDVVAEEKVYTGVQDADAALRTVCSKEEARTWIREKKDQPIYFVIGMETLRNARFQQSVSDLVGGHATATVPLNATGSVPISGSGGGTVGRSGSAEGYVNGIFSVKLMKAKWKWLKKEDTPTWENKIHWKFVYDQIKGAAREEKEFGLELEPLSDVEELVELRDRFEEMEAREKAAAAVVDPDNE